MPSRGSGSARILACTVHSVWQQMNLYMHVCMQSVPFFFMALTVRRLLFPITFSPAMYIHIHQQWWAHQLPLSLYTYLSTSTMNGLGFCRTVCSGRAPTNLRFFKMVHSVSHAWHMTLYIYVAASSSRLGTTYMYIVVAVHIQDSMTVARANAVLAVHFNNIVCWSS